MTPKIYNKLALKIHKVHSSLAKAGLLLILAFCVGIFLNLYYEAGLFPVTLVPINFVFFLGLLGIIHHWFKTEPEKKQSDFDVYWNESSLFRKAVLWYGAVFCTVSLVFLAFILVVSIIKTVLSIL